MQAHIEVTRQLLRQGPVTARTLMNALAVSQPTVSRIISALGPEVLRVGAARSIQYALLDPGRQDLLANVYRVSVDGTAILLGNLVPVLPGGFVMQEVGGRSLHTDGLPWWVADMRPQGFLGRAYNQRHGALLGLPERLDDWNDNHVLQALIRQGDNLPGNLLVGRIAHEQFLNLPDPDPIEPHGKSAAYAELALAAARGDLHGSSAGGEQPKFTAYARLANGEAAHVIVKFSAAVDSAVSLRWRDLLLAEHIALQTLADAGLPAARSSVVDDGVRRFLEVVRFDRMGCRGRRAVHSLATLDAQFAGVGGRWPDTVKVLARERVITKEAAAIANVLWAFGTLIGNTDMHSGNLAFVSDGGRPYQIAPAYDMTPMVFAPTAGGDIPDRELGLNIGEQVPAAAWKTALPLAVNFVRRLRLDGGLSADFRDCLAVLEQHVQSASQRIGWLAA